MADQPITGLPTKTASGIASTDKMLGIDSAEGYQILVRDVAKYIIENCDVSTLAGSVQTPKAAIDGLNSNSKTIYTGTTSFAEIDPVRQDNQGLGAWIDAKISSVISSFERDTIHMMSDVNDGPCYSAIFFKASDSYYAGILWSYHQNARNTTWYFVFSNGTYKLRPLAVPIL